MFLEFLKSRDFGIDFGTSNTLVYVKGHGIALSEPSVVVKRADGGPNGKKKLQAAGLKARGMIGKVPVYLSVVRPIKDGVIADFALAELLLKEFMRRVCADKNFFRSAPRMVICVPCRSTQVERRAIRESALAAGAKEVFLHEEAMAAALGGGLPLTQAIGSMVVNLGGGTTEVAVTSLGGLVYKDSLRVGGDKMDEAIMTYVRKNYGVLIGDLTAEKIKKEIGAACFSSHEKFIEVKGRNVAMGLPKSIKLSSPEILEAVSEILDQIVQAVKNGLTNTPPELGADIATHGILLTGGGALLRDIDKLMSQRIGLPVSIAKDPLTCVVKGCGMAVERVDESSRFFI